MLRNAFFTMMLLAPGLALGQVAPAQPVPGAAAPVPAVAPAPPPPPAPVGFNNPALTQILEAVRQSYGRGEKPMVILDLEGTLFDNRTRVLQILREYADRDLRGARPQFAQIIANMTPLLIQYMLTDTLRTVGITEDAVVNNAAVFWSQRFFTDDYLKYDTVNAGAVRFVRDLYSSGARIVYLTSRDAQRQLVGSVRQLRDSGFPIGIQGAELIMRPTAQTQDAVFRQQVTNYLRQYGKIVATIDSEPANANVYRRAFPEAICVLYNGPRAPNPPPLLPNITALPSFD